MSTSCAGVVRRVRKGPKVIPVDVELEALGRRIGELRTSQGWRLTDLAQATGYTTSYISQIERGVSVPSLTALATVAVALGVEMIALLDDVAKPQITITRAGKGTELKLSDGRAFEVVTRLGTDRPYTVILQVISRVPATFRHFGERFILVLKGEIEMTFGDDQYQIKRNGTIHYGAHEIHIVRSSSEKSSDVLIISSPALI